MPLFIAAFLGALAAAAGSIAGRVLISLGITAVTYVGVQASLDWAQTFIASRWSQLPSQAVAILGALRIGEDIGIIFGACLARMTLNGLTSDSITVWRTKRPGG